MQRRHLITPVLTSLASGLAAAHADHGFSGAHWHANDLFGPALLFVAIAAAVAVRKKK
jgi:hypothetical protein